MYYILVVFKDKTKYGKTLPNKYKRAFNAERKFDSLVKSGLYEVVMIREEEESYTVSTSYPYKKWETK